MNTANSKEHLSFAVILFVCVVPLLFINCSGKETLGVDTTPPERVYLIPHLGDTGDSIYVNGIRLNDRNNGIDAVPDNNWLRIQWYPATDPDLDYLKVYRFGDDAPTTFVDSLSRAQILTNQFVDNRLHLSNPVGQTWFYFVKGYDQFGNFSISDTVSYKLLEKPALISPPDFAQISLSNDVLTFDWFRTNDALQFRVLVFDYNHDYIWHYDYFIDSETTGDILSIDYWGPNLSNYEAIVWRVDSLDNFTLEGISMSGAESFERTIYLTP